MIKPFRSKRFQKFAKNSLTLFLGSKFQAILLFIQSIVVARSLGVGRYGKWAIVVSICGLVVNFLTLKTADVLGKFFVELRVKKDYTNLGLIIKKTLYLELLTRTLAVAIILVFSIAAVNLFNGPDSMAVYLLYGMSFFFQFIGAIWFCLERDHSNYKTIASLSFLRALLRLLVIFILFVILDKVSLIALAFSFFFSSLIDILIKIFRTEKLLSQYGNLSIKGIFRIKSEADLRSYPIFGEYWQFVRTSYLSTSITSVMKKIDILAVGFFFSSESVGLLKLGKNIARIIQDVATNMSRPVYQEFNELISAGKHRRILSFLKQNLKYYLAGLFMVLLVISLFIEPFINMVYGKEFLASAIYFRVYMILVFMGLGGFWMKPLLLALKGWNYNLKMLLVSLPILVVSIVGFKYLWGIVGIIIACIFIRFSLKISFFVFIWSKLRAGSTKD